MYKYMYIELATRTRICDRSVQNSKHNKKISRINRKSVCAQYDFNPKAVPLVRSDSQENIIMLQPENKEEKSALLCLPDDVLIQILGYLDRSTQLMLTQMHIRFLTIMPNIWRSKYRSSSLSMMDDDFIYEKDFRYFMGSLQSTLNVLQMELGLRLSFKILTSFVFPKVHDFQFSSHAIHLEDSDMPSIVRAFPNLRTFAPHGRFSGKYFEGFHRLENLILTHCTSFEAIYLIRILKIRRLKTLKLGVFKRSQIQDTDVLPFEGIKSLEVLQCNALEMDRWFLENLKHLTQLKQLNLFDHFNDSFLQNVVVATNRSRFRSLEVNNRHTLSIILRSNYIHFEVLKVLKLNIFMEERFAVLGLKNVKEIYLIKCNIVEDLNLRMLISLKSTELVSLDECEFRFRKYTFVAKDIAKGRSKRLNLHLDPDMISYSTYPKSKMIWTTEGEHELFKLSMEKPNISCNSESFSIYFD